MMIKSGGWNIRLLSCSCLFPTPLSKLSLTLHLMFNGRELRSLTSFGRVWQLNKQQVCILCVCVGLEPKSSSEKGSVPAACDSWAFFCLSQKQVLKSWWWWWEKKSSSISIPKNGSSPRFESHSSSSPLPPSCPQLYKGPNTSFHIQSLQANSDYRFRVCAVRQCQDAPELSGPYSPTVTLSQQRSEAAAASGSAGGLASRASAESGRSRRSLTDEQCAFLLLMVFAVIAILIAFVIQYFVIKWAVPATRLQGYSFISHFVSSVLVFCFSFCLSHVDRKKVFGVQQEGEPSWAELNASYWCMEDVERFSLAPAIASWRFCLGHVVPAVCCLFCSHFFFCCSTAKASGARGELEGSRGMARSGGERVGLKRRFYSSMCWLQYINIYICG